MSFFDQMFDSPHHYHRHHSNDAIHREIAALDPGPELLALHRQVAQLRLLVSALAAVIEQKGLATRAELETAVQQIDLLDGVEDGMQGTNEWKNAPRCAGCDRYVNPKRGRCIYCDAPIEAPAAAADALCVRCGAKVPQNETFFTELGLQCARCVQGPT